ERAVGAPEAVGTQIRIRKEVEDSVHPREVEGRDCVRERNRVCLPAVGGRERGQDKAVADGGSGETRYLPRNRFLVEIRDEKCSLGQQGRSKTHRKEKSDEISHDRPP